MWIGWAGWSWVLRYTTNLQFRFSSFRVIPTILNNQNIIKNYWSSWSSSCSIIDSYSADWAKSKVWMKDKISLSGVLGLADFFSPHWFPFQTDAVTQVKTVIAVDQNKSPWIIRLGFLTQLLTSVKQGSDIGFGEQAKRLRQNEREWQKRQTSLGNGIIQFCVILLFCSDVFLQLQLLMGASVETVSPRINLSLHPNTNGNKQGLIVHRVDLHHMCVYTLSHFCLLFPVENQTI